MAAIAKYKIDTAFTNANITSIASLANAGFTGPSDAIANQTELALLMDLEINLGSINPTGTPYIEVHLVTTDNGGSTYEDTPASTNAAAAIVATAQVSTGSTAKKVIVKGIPIPPGSFKIYLKNVTGQTLNASNNSLYYRLYGYDLNG